MALSLYSFSFLFVNFTPIELAVFSKRTSSLYGSQKKRFSLFFLSHSPFTLPRIWMARLFACLSPGYSSFRLATYRLCVLCIFIYKSLFSLSFYISLFVFFCSISDAFWRVSVQVNQRGYIVETKEASSDFSLAAGQPGLFHERKRPITIDLLVHSYLYSIFFSFPSISLILCYFISKSSNNRH